MRNSILLIPLIFYVPGLSAAHPQSVTTKCSSPPTCCVSNTDIATRLLADNVGALQQSVLTLTTAVNNLGTATEKASKAVANLPAPPPTTPKPLGQDGWLTLMAIIIALSAYLATLRWILIDKLGRARRRVCYLRGQPENADRKERIDQITHEMQKHQRKIREISWVDFTLALPLLTIVYMLFSPYLCEPEWSAPFIAALFFVVAIFLLVGRHVGEWLKTIKAWANFEVVCKK